MLLIHNWYQHNNYYANAVINNAIKKNTPPPPMFFFYIYCFKNEHTIAFLYHLPLCSAGKKHFHDICCHLFSLHTVSNTKILIHCSLIHADLISHLQKNLYWCTVSYPVSCVLQQTIIIKVRQQLQLTQFYLHLTKSENLINND